MQIYGPVVEKLAVASGGRASPAQAAAAWPLWGTWDTVGVRVTGWLLLMG
jgi:hypothetical protein